MSTIPAWLNSAVFYEIYPQSFYDSNGDGIGDLNGIIDKLDYVKSLGCNAIWMNPCFVSPFSDAGYDVADFYKVAPRYGTNADMKRLLKAAHKKGIRVILDLVAGHTSVEHPWFKQSCRHEKNKYSNWFIWTPTVWQSTDDGTKSIQGFAERDGSYVTNFLWFQPALNYGYANPDPAKPWQLPVDHPDILAVREEMKNIIRFWLDMGADGFRVDMASYIVKGDKDWSESGMFWKEVRTMLNRDYPEAVLISEWFYPEAAIKSGFHIDFMANGEGNEARAYTALFRKENTRTFHDGNGHSFFDRRGQGDITEFMDIYLRHYKNTSGKGYISLFSGNHDMTRISIGRRHDELELVFAFLLTMPGVPFIYYGDEIGMRYQQLPSKEGGYQRTGSRTPMQWDSSRNAGFSTAFKNDIYLPVDPAKDKPTVEKQIDNPNSLYNRVRRLIEIRKQHPALAADGAFKCIYCKANTYPLIYSRSIGNERYLIALNPSQAPVQASFKLSPSRNTPNLVYGRGIELYKSAGLFSVSMRGISLGIFEF